MTQHRYTLEQIDAMALPLAQAVCERLFGQVRLGSGQIWMQSPTRTDPNWTSFSFNARSGVWKDFGGSLGGGKGVLSLVAATLGRGSEAPDWTSAIRWVKDFIGLTDHAPSAIDLERLKQETARRDAESQAHSEKQRAAARGLWLAGTPLDGTDPASLYLKSARGVDVTRLKAGVPRALRFHPRVFAKDDDAKMRGPHPAILGCISRSPDGLVAVHRTYLRQHHGAWEKFTWPACKTGKQVKGAYAGGSIRLTRGQSGKSLRDMPAGEWPAVHEGIEDGLTTALVKPELRSLVAVTIANIGALQLPEQCRGLYIVKQNDTKQITISQFECQMDRLADRGIEPAIVEFPPQFKDANDVLRGIEREAMGAAA